MNDRANQARRDECAKSADSLFVPGNYPPQGFSPNEQAQCGSAMSMIETQAQTNRRLLETRIYDLRRRADQLEALLQALPVKMIGAAEIALTDLIVKL